MVYDLDVSWVSGLEKIANRFLKRWAGLYRKALVSILYRPREQFGLQLTFLVCFYKRLQIGRAFLSKYSADGTLNSIYASMLAHDNSLERVWRPAPELELLDKSSTSASLMVRAIIVASALYLVDTFAIFTSRIANVEC